MPSNSALRGQAKRHRESLTAAHKSAVTEFSDHIKDCAICTKAKADVFKRCDYGWWLAKLELRTKRAVEHYDNDHPDNQERLF